MKQTVYLNDFERAFSDFGRRDNFSNKGLQALFEYLEEYEESTGEEIELDVIALCCEYSEYENIKEFQEYYGEEYETLEDIEQVTTVIPVDSESFIIQVF